MDVEKDVVETMKDDNPAKKVVEAEKTDKEKEEEFEDFLFEVRQEILDNMLFDKEYYPKFDNTTLKQAKLLLLDAPFDFLDNLDKVDKWDDAMKKTMNELVVSE